jgi:hypothetical protein
MDEEDIEREIESREIEEIVTVLRLGGWFSNAT